MPRNRIFTFTPHLLAGLLLSGAGHAAQTAGGVNWLDPLPYTKPAFVPISVPDENTVANKYWVDFSAGSGSSCTSSSPCRSLADVVGKPGTNGGPAIIYVKGSGSGGLDLWGTGGIRGSGNAVNCVTGDCSNWILIKPWPAGSPGCAAECSATTSGRNSWIGVNVHHVILDGGPDMKILFNATNTGAFEYVWQVNTDYITAYRVRSKCTSTSASARLWAWGSTGVSDNISVINSEFYGCNDDGGMANSSQNSSIYLGADDGGGFTNFLMKNNIVRQMSGEGIEINVRATSSGGVIEGNAFHHNGRGTCRNDFKCRPHVTLSTMSGGMSNMTLRNNLMWVSGSACVYVRAGNPQIYNNTFLDWATKNSAGSGTLNNPECLSDGSASSSNNIFYSSNGQAPYSSSFGGGNNVCESSESCGSGKITWSSAILQSIDPNNANFAKLASGSAAINAGSSNALTVDYAGAARPQGGAVDIGAFEFASGGGGGATGSACDVNNDNVTNVSDVQLCVNQAIGSAACGTGDIDNDTQCNVTDVQRVINAALGGACVTQ